MKFTILFLVVQFVLLSTTMGIIIFPNFPYFPSFPSFPYFPGFPSLPKDPIPENTCTGPYEVWLDQGDAPNCDTTCATLCQKCIIVFIQAPSGCYCKPGYARDSKGICIPIWQCSLCPKQKD